MRKIRIGSAPTPKRTTKTGAMRKSTPATSYVEGMVKARQIDLFPSNPIPKLFRLRNK